MHLQLPHLQSMQKMSERDSSNKVDNSKAKSRIGHCGNSLTNLILG